LLRRAPRIAERSGRKSVLATYTRSPADDLRGSAGRWRAPAFTLDPARLSVPGDRGLGGTTPLAVVSVRLKRASCSYGNCATLTGALTVSESSTQGLARRLCTRISGCCALRRPPTAPSLSSERAAGADGRQALATVTRRSATFDRLGRDYPWRVRSGPHRTSSQLYNGVLGKWSFTDNQRVDRR